MTTQRVYVALRHFALVITRSPLAFGSCALLLHLLLLLPILAAHHFDPSVLIVAGDRYVNQAAGPVPIIVRAHSDGYDGQFYYRLALTPVLPQATAAGITLDHPAWRMQRILLPLLVRAVSLGNPGAIPWSFAAVNLAGIAAIAAASAWLARSYALPPLVPLALVLWPGWLIALTHDTTEITAGAFLLGALCCYLERRLVPYTALMALAALARETAILAAAGIAAYEFYLWACPPNERRWRGMLCASAALLPFLAWHETVTRLWQSAPQAHGLSHNAGIPLLGWFEAVLANISNQAVGAATKPHDLAMRATVLSGIAIIVLFTVAALSASRQALRTRATGGIAAAWLPVAALMMTLTANGPLIEPTAFLRAFTECWMIGWLLLGLAGKTIAIPRLAGVLSVFLLLRNWQLCWIQLH
jgi:hypothetical protein